MIVSIVIPVYGAESLLTSCLAALDANTSPSRGILWDVVAIDNATGYDINAETVIRNPENLGFGTACNQGADAATGDLICFLNVDTEVQSGWLTPLISALDDPEVAVAGPRIIHPDGTLQTAGGIRTWHGNGGAGGEELKNDGPSCDADGVTGACLLIRKDVFNAVGQFDTRFINGYEDVALCLAVREAGWRIRLRVGVNHRSPRVSHAWQMDACACKRRGDESDLGQPIGGSRGILPTPLVLDRNPHWHHQRVRTVLRFLVGIR